MIDAYEVGQKLTADDFIDPFYFPPMKWEYAEIEEITDDTVTLHYYDYNEPQGDLVKTYTRADMEEMLGWDLSADDKTIDVEDSGTSSTKKDVDNVMESDTIEVNGAYELVASRKPAYVKVKNGHICEVHFFGSYDDCVKEFRSL